MKNLLPLLYFILLTSCNAKVYDLNRVLKGRPTAVIFLSTECPISQRYIPTINQLAADFPQIQFKGVFPKQESRKSIQAYKADNHIHFQVLSDAESKLLQELGATHTPEVFLLAADRTVLYHGAIDNWYYNMEQITQKATDHFLKNAIELHLRHKPIFLKDTRPVGCRIEQ